MQRQLLLVLLVACTGLTISISAWETPERIELLEFAGRKLMQEKSKPKGGKGKGDPSVPKKLGDGKQSFSSDGSKEMVVPKGGLKLRKAKGALDEEEDDDIRFMEEEKNLDVPHPKPVDSGKDDAAPAGKTTRNSGKKSKFVKKPAEKNGDATETTESLDGGDVKKEPGAAAKDKKPSEKTKASRPKKSKKPVEKTTGEKLGEDLVVEPIADDGDQKPGEEVKASAAKTSEKPVVGMEIEKIVDEVKKERVAKKKPVEKAKSSKKPEKPTEELEIEKTEDGFDEVKEPRRDQRTEEDTAEEVSFDPETQSDEIIPVNIDEEDTLNKEPVEIRDEREIEAEAESTPQKKPVTKATKEQNKPKTKERKEPGINPKPSGDTKNKAKTPVKIDAPTKKTTNSTKKSVDPKKKAEPVKKDKPLKEASKEINLKKEQVPTINFPGGGVEDVEDLQVGSLSTESDDEDDDLNFVDEVTRLPTKFQETAGQVKETLLPGFQKLSEKSRSYFTSANEQMTQRFTPLVGEQVAPVVASLISYALLLMPLILVLYMLERIRASLSLAKVLFFINLYLGAYFITLVLASFALHSEPMAFLFRNARSSCVFLQLLQALGFLLYLTLYTVVFFRSCSNAGFLDKLAAGFQWVIVALFGLHYYVTVFHKTMAMKAPKTNWKIYLVYSSAFALLALFARAKIEPSKKEYYYSPVDDPDEVIPVDKRS